GRDVVVVDDDVEAVGRGVLPQGNAAGVVDAAEPAVLVEAPAREQPAKAPTLADPVAYLRRLLSSGRFHKDSGLGRIYHPGCVSLRENAPADSLHVVIHDDHISAHVDRVSPLGEKPGYSFHRAALHNAVGAAQDLVRLLRGRKGDHRSHLDCEWVWDGYEPTPDPAHLLDPRAWSVHVEARVAGILDDTRMRKAFDAVVGHRPVDHDPVRVVSCDGDEDLDSARDGLLSEPVAMNQWPPLQAVLAHHPEGDVLLLNVNHAASDGFSAVRVMESIAAAYADTGPPAPALDFLAVNDLPVRPASRPVSVVEGWYRVAVEKVRDALANPARLAPDHPADRPGYGLHFVRLSVADTRRVANVHRQGRHATCCWPPSTSPSASGTSSTGRRAGASACWCPSTSAPRTGPTKWSATSR
ncbi:MAG TPA: hypothetical protein VNT52_16640, partial [Acidimicrobiales bacterium]|nr:hypothetical protein [Acidimicrobiales bacterium]